jgi:septum site-determining protein MinC
MIEEDAAGDLFATATMAELSARQGRMADAIAIYRQLLRGAASEGPSADPERVAKWQARLAELESGVTVATAAPAPRIEVAAARETPTLVVREPVRSGQVIYAQGRDLIVMASVNPGAQVLADGHIHVYGALKGRAVAGAHGRRDAQVFCLALEAELVGVDTGYVVSADEPQDLWGGPARVFLTEEGTCTLAALAPGKVSAPAPVSRARRLFRSL